MNREPRIEFPCDYPIKILGDNHSRFTDRVVELVRRHAPELPDHKVSSRESRHGNYISVTVVIRARGEDQLERLHNELKADESVRMVL
jgi:putative lipoic acid-binding regulatory protein